MLSFGGILLSLRHNLPLQCGKIEGVLMKLAIIGFGVVGQGLAAILNGKRDFLRDTEGFEPQIVAVATRAHGSLVRDAGLDLNALLEASARGHFDHYPDQRGLSRDWNALAIARSSRADVLIELTPSDLLTGQPALDVCRAALESRKHVVLANKGPVAVAYEELRAQAEAAGVRLLFEAAVMAGTPALRLGMQALAGCQINAVRGILNGTTNYILTQMESGMTYADALAQAQALGYAEADPTADVDGWDAAAKAIILAAALFRRKLTFDDMQVSGISAITPEDIAAAAAAGERWKLIAQITPEGGSVRAVRIAQSHPLAGVSGAMNAITYETDLMGEITLIGAGAGGTETGFAVLSDLLEIHRDRFKKR
jgi:homoserine dehydrogenase